MVRAPGALGPREGLKVVAGDPSRADELTAVIANQDVVISCLGQRARTDATLLQDTAAATLEAMSRTAVRRYLVLSQGLLFPSRNPVIALLRLTLARHVADSIAMERLVGASDTDWTIVRPPRLLEGGVPRGYRIEAGARPGGAWAMERVDLAAFLLDEAETGDHLKTVVGITSA